MVHNKGHPALAFSGVLHGCFRSRVHQLFQRAVCERLRQQRRAHNRHDDVVQRPGRADCDLRLQLHGFLCLCQRCVPYCSAPSMEGQIRGRQLFLRVRPDCKPEQLHGMRQSGERQRTAHARERRKLLVQELPGSARPVQHDKLLDNHARRGEIQVLPAGRLLGRDILRKGSCALFRNIVLVVRAYRFHIREPDRVRQFMHHCRFAHARANLPGL
ncbi:Uncharacterised protein [uncultured archaeon]|nr:Uncharacterised protein [uncultured archaeon]